MNCDELEERIEMMRKLERTYRVIGQDQRAQNMRNRYQDLEAVLASIERVDSPNPLREDDQS